MLDNVNDFDDYNQYKYTEIYLKKDDFIYYCNIKRSEFEIIKSDNIMTIRFDILKLKNEGNNNYYRKILVSNDMYYGRVVFYKI